MGAASAVLVSDPALQGSDSLTTAKVLAAAISDANPDLVIAGSESSDGYTGTVPEQIAAVLGLRRSRPPSRSASTGQPQGRTPDRCRTRRRRNARCRV